MNMETTKFKSNRRAGLFLVCLFSFGLSFCQSKRPSLYNGTVYQRVRTYNESTKSYRTTPQFFDRFYYIKDSIVVAVVQEIHYRTEHQNPTVFSYPIIMYTLIDTRTQRFYDFSSFSDTAILMESYGTDSTGQAKGGWYMFMNAPKDYSGNVVALSDTLVNGSRLKRYRGKRITALPDNEPYIPDEVIISVECNPVSRPLHHLNVLNDLPGCAVVMIESFRDGKPLNYNLFEYSPEPLTAEQSRIIDALLSKVSKQKNRD